MLHHDPNHMYGGLVDQGDKRVAGISLQRDPDRPSQIGLPPGAEKTDAHSLIGRISLPTPDHLKAFRIPTAADAASAELTPAQEKAVTVQTGHASDYSGVDLKKMAAQKIADQKNAAHHAAFHPSRRVPSGASSPGGNASLNRMANRMAPA